MSKNLGQLIKDFSIEEWRALAPESRKQLIKLGVVKFKELNSVEQEPEPELEPEPEEPDVNDSEEHTEPEDAELSE